VVKFYKATIDNLAGNSISASVFYLMLFKGLYSFAVLIWYKTLTAA
jgi:hypothetical protein